MDEQPDAVTCNLLLTSISSLSTAAFPPSHSQFQASISSMQVVVKHEPIPYRLNGQGKPQDSKEHEGIYKTTSAPELQQLPRFHHHQFFKVVRKVTVKYADQQTQDRGNVNASTFILQVELNLKLQVFGS
jgi:hypothetical protein